VSCRPMSERFAEALRVGDLRPARPRTAPGHSTETTLASRGATWGPARRTTRVDWAAHDRSSRSGARSGPRRDGGRREMQGRFRADSKHEKGRRSEGLDDGHGFFFFFGPSGGRGPDARRRPYCGPGGSRRGRSKRGARRSPRSVHRETRRNEAGAGQVEEDANVVLRGGGRWRCRSPGAGRQNRAAAGPLPVGPLNRTDSGAQQPEAGSSSFGTTSQAPSCEIQVELAGRSSPPGGTTGPRTSQNLRAQGYRASLPAASANRARDPSDCRTGGSTNRAPALPFSARSRSPAAALGGHQCRRVGRRHSSTALGRGGGAGPGTPRPVRALSTAGAWPQSARRE